ncbi:MAG: hypothetical protein FJX80_10985 [Bacteroidetes bacterium]|nr:hypothetical protein [Bacteroidota bacterium]
MATKVQPLLIKVDIPGGKPEEVAYLIHGAPFELHCTFERYGAALIHNPIPVGKWNWLKCWHSINPQGVFEGTANYYQPYVEVFLYQKPWFKAFWWLWLTKGGAQRMRIQLKVEFPNVIEQDLLLELHHQDFEVAEVMKSAPSVQPPVTLTPDLDRLKLGFRLNLDAPRFSMPTMIINPNSLQKDLNP